MSKPKTVPIQPVRQKGNVKPKSDKPNKSGTTDSSIH